MMKMNRYMIFAVTLATLALACSCVQDESFPDPPKEYKEGQIVYVDLTRWHSVSSKDSADVARLWDAMHVMTTVQGIVNRDAPRIYIDYVNANGMNVDSWWYELYSHEEAWLAGREVVKMYDPVEVAELFRDRFNGLVVYDNNVASTSDVASTVAGVEDLIAVRYDETPGSMYRRLIKHGFEPKVWLVNEDGSSKFHDKLEPYRWAIDNYLKQGKCSGRYAADYVDQYWRKRCGNGPLNHHQLTNHDFFISQRSFFFDLSPWDDEAPTDAPEVGVGADLKVLQEIMLTIYQQNGGQQFCHVGGFPAWAYKYCNHSTVGGKHTAVDLEWEYTRVISAYNAYQDADALANGAMANASFWHHMPLQDKYPQKWVTRDELKAKGYLTADGKVNRSNRYIIVYVGDFDAASWIYQNMPVYWPDPARGSVPLMWSISPVLCERAPMVMHHLWTTATPNDYFAAADNGAGYLNPGMLEEPRPLSGLPSGLDAWAAHSKPYYERWDMSVTGFIIDGFAGGMSQKGFECYSKFSYNGIVPQKTPQRSFLVNGMPVLRSEGSASADKSIDAANIIVNATLNHKEFPFYWFRVVLKSPSWYKAVKEEVEKTSTNVVWLDGPSYFELLRCFLEEQQN